jgi:hypothetical protein
MTLAVTKKTKDLTAVFIVFAILGYCCNSEKRVLNDADKTQHVVNKYLETHPARTDTITSYKPGDTVTTLLFSYDTTTVRDTLNLRDTVKIRQTVTKYAIRVDTLLIKINNFDLLKECQTGLATSEYERKQGVISVDAAKTQVAKWMFYFWALVGGVIAIVLLFIFFKR